MVENYHSPDSRQGVARRTRRGWRAALVLLLFIPACADFERPLKPDAPASGVVLVTATDFATGFLAAIDAQNFSATKDILQIYNDSLPRYSADDKATYMVQRLGSDSLLRLDNLAGYQNVYEKSVGAQSNPQDAAFLPGDRIAVTLLNRNFILILNRSTGAVVKEIDLSSYADSDGYAEISHALFANGFLYTTIQRLNRAATGSVWPPVGQSYLVKIDIATYQVLQSTLLTHTNPISRLHYHAARNTLLFAAAGFFYSNAALDGACLEYDLATDTLLTPPITELEAGYEIADCNIRADGSGVFIGNDTNLNSVLGVFDATTHTLTRIAATLASSNGGYFSDFLLHSNDKVYLADRNVFKPGVRVFSGVLLSEETASPIYTGLPPFVLEEVP